MPVLLAAPPDPTDFVMAGETMRLAALAEPVSALAGLLPSPRAPFLLSQNQNYPPQHPAFTPYGRHVRYLFDYATPLSNTIATTAGAFVPLELALPINFEQSSQRWSVAGVTRDSVGTVLASCRVVVLEVGQLAVNQPAVAGETVSDGVGSYAVEVGRNTAYQVIAYQAGAPDVAGISVATVTPFALA